MTASVLDRIKQDNRGAEILSLLLGVTIRPDKTTAIRCPRPSLHKNGDKHPSCVCKPDAVRLDCSCGLGLGLFDLVVEKGLAQDAKGAASWLEERLYPSANGNGHQAPPERWPWFPNTAKEKLGWEVTTEDNVATIVAPTFAVDGTPGKRKIRHEKGKGKPTGRFDGEGVVGLLGLDRALSALEESENPKVAILCGETDLLAWTWHAQNEGIAIPGVSHSAGEGSSMKEFLSFFKGVDVLYVADNDDAGAKGAEDRRKELAPVAKSFTVLHPPAGKDACDYLRMGGTVRALLRTGEPVEEKPTETPTLQIHTLSEILAMPVEEPAWFVEGMVGRKRMAVLTAAPKTGKSAASLGLAFRLCAGTAGTWLGTDFNGSDGLRCLYLCAEGGIRLIQQRYEPLSEGLPGGWHERLHFLTERPWPRFDSEKGLSLLRATLDKIGGTDLLVIDPFARFRDVEKENDNAATQILCENLRAVTEDYNLATLLVHHPSKISGTDQSGTGFYGGRGASALFGEVDAAISLRKDAKTGEIHAYFDLRDAPPIEPGRRLRLNKDTLWLDYEGELGSGDGGQERAIEPRIVLDALKKHPEGLKWSQAYKSIPGASRASWYRYRADVFGALSGQIRMTDGVVFFDDPNSGAKFDA